MKNTHKTNEIPSNAFVVHAPFRPTGDQPDAIASLLRNIQLSCKDQVLLGVTGSGKTYTIAEVIELTQMPTLVISHNKTLAAQTYQEFRDFFPQNAVSYFVSYYDYYQPEAYIPHSDTYIEKTTEINEEIEKLRLFATMNILTRKDAITVASVSCIYNIGSPREYGHFVLEVKPGMTITRESVTKRLVQLQYSRNDIAPERGTFRIRGETIDIFPAYEDTCVRFVIEQNILKALEKRDPMTGNFVESLTFALIYPSKHYMTDPSSYKKVFEEIRNDLEIQVSKFTKEKKLIEAQRIKERVTYDLEMIEELGFVNGIENYSRYFDGRKEGEPPYTLFDYYQEAYGNNWLLIIDESHMTIPQVRGMYNGDRSRKQTLIDFGFRLPSALDNRPLRFDEFVRRMPITIYASATPNEWEIERSKNAYAQVSQKAIDDPINKKQNEKNIITSHINKNPSIVEQLIRPTGLIDPNVRIKPIENQIQDVILEIKKRTEKKERVLVTTLTKRMAEDLSEYLTKEQILVHYLHSDIETLERSDILSDLRSGAFDVVVGVNLLREGLDLPEVSLVAVLDADKEGFLRSRTSLIQTMGRAARHINGEVILYADKMTDSIKSAVSEVKRRRTVQLAYNTLNNITPLSISKPIRNRLVTKSEKIEKDVIQITPKEIDNMTPLDKEELKKKLSKSMKDAAKELNFELAAHLRDFIDNLK
jgi:excinuclease ABC subunit B